MRVKSAWPVVPATLSRFARSIPARTSRPTPWWTGPVRSRKRRGPQSTAGVTPQDPSTPAPRPRCQVGAGEPVTVGRVEGGGSTGAARGVSIGAEGRAADCGPSSRSRDSDAMSAIASTTSAQVAPLSERLACSPCGVLTTSVPVVLPPPSSIETRRPMKLAPAASSRKRVVRRRTSSLKAPSSGHVAGAS